MKTLAKNLMQAKSGFTLLELIIAISIMAIIAGAAVPVASMAINSKKARVTVEELDGLQLAAGEYFRDTGELPTAISDMESAPSGVTGWAGPYLQRFSIDSLSGLSQYAVDAWSQAYTVTAAGSLLTISSAGEGGVHGDSNDIAVVLDVTPIRRKQTMQVLDIVNGAILKYNETFLDDDPLGATYSNLLQQLVDEGYLPATAPFELDGWGDAFTADPPSLTPVVRVKSTNL